MVADSELCTAEGIAGDTDFIVKERGGGNGFAYVVMHELGHVFGLDHGPFDGFSVMSGGAFTYPTAGPDSLLDYTRYPIEARRARARRGPRATPRVAAQATPTWTGSTGRSSARASSTSPGRATGPIDFDCSGAPFWMPPYSNYISQTPVEYDVNGDGVIGTVPAVKPEWPKLKFGLGRIGG